VLTSYPLDPASAQRALAALGVAERLAEDALATVGELVAAVHGLPAEVAWESPAGRAFVDAARRAEEGMAAGAAVADEVAADIGMLRRRLASAVDAVR